MEWKNSEETISLPIGFHTIEFETIAGYNKPNNINVEILSNQNVSRTGVYTIQTIIGIDYCNEDYKDQELKVLTNKQDGGWQKSSAPVIEPDVFYLNYGGVFKCVICPVNGQWRITKLTDTSFIRGLIEPTTIGGQWRPQGTDIWYNHNQSIQFPEGQYNIEFKPVDGYLTPPLVHIKKLNTYETINALGIYLQEG